MKNILIKKFTDHKTRSIQTVESVVDLLSNNNGAEICRNMQMAEKNEHLCEKIVIQKTKIATKWLK